MGPFRRYLIPFVHDPGALKQADAENDSSFLFES